jgi:hypothetical protein
MAGRKRHDPVSRMADGRRQHDRIKNKDPNKDYVLVHPDAVDYYLEEMGYEIELARPDGPRSSGRKLPDGSEVRSGGHVLMSIAREKREAWDAELAMQSLEVERRILKDEGLMADGLRGRVLGMRNVYSDDRSPEYRGEER